DARLGVALADLLRRRAGVEVPHRGLPAALARRGACEARLVGGAVPVVTGVGGRAEVAPEVVVLLPGEEEGGVLPEEPVERRRPALRRPYDEEVRDGHIGGSAGAAQMPASTGHRRSASGGAGCVTGRSRQEPGG